MFGSWKVHSKEASGSLRESVWSSVTDSPTFYSQLSLSRLPRRSLRTCTLIATMTPWEEMLTLCLPRSDEDDLAFKEKQKKEAAELKALAAKGTLFFLLSRSELRMLLMVLCSCSEGSYGRCWSQEVGIPSDIFFLSFNANLLLLGLARSNRLIVLLLLYWNIISSVLKCIYLPSKYFHTRDHLHINMPWTLSYRFAIPCSVSWIGS